MKTFINRRLNSCEVGFWDPLSKLRIKTFASLKKLETVKAHRSLVAQLLVASKSSDINLKKVLKYELSVVPCSPAHTDGSLRKMATSVLWSTLKETLDVSTRLPSDSDTEHLTAYVLDGMTIVQVLRTFGKLASNYYITITAPLGKNNCNRLDVVFDRYDNPHSIKESERQRRGASPSYEVRSTPVPRQ